MNYDSVVSSGLETKMITVDHVLEACEIRKVLGGQTTILTMFIFEHQPSDTNKSTSTLHLYAEIYAGDTPRLEEKNSFLFTLATRDSSVICPMCRERFSARRFATHIKKHKIQKLEITDSLQAKGKAYIQSRIDSLSKPVILPKLKIQKKKKRKKRLVFSAGAPGLGKKS